MRVVGYIDVALFGGLALVCLRYWRVRRDGPSCWLAVTFGVLALAVFGALFLPNSADHRIHGYAPGARVVLVLIFTYPYALFRFGRAFREASRRLDLAATGLTLAVMVALLVVPLDTDPNAPRSAGMVALTFLVLAQWAGLSGLVAVWLWRAGGGLATVARRRMRMLAVGAGALAAALLPSALPRSVSQSDVVTVVTKLLPIGSALLFFVGFVPPAWLRTVWRRNEQAGLRNVELALITADTPAHVAARVLPHVAGLVGGRGALLVGPDGKAIGAYGYVEGTDPIVVELSRGRRLLVEASPYAPVFGAEEISLLQALGSFVDLVLERVELLDRERAARDALARTNAELETLVYGISHDLRSPLVSLTGYLEYLRSDYGTVLGEEGAHYLSRMAVSARYMEDLIGDLLELSRVGRAQTEIEDVDLGELVSDLADGMGVSWPQLRVEAAGLPIVRMNAVRARQLFTNLFENAARHGGRPDLTIRVTATPASGRAGAVIDVADDGVGIPDEYREKVFGIFERLSRPDESTPGTGIGLALCRRIVESAGGVITLVAADADDAPATGAHFRITLPAAAVVGRALESQRVSM